MEKWNQDFHNISILYEDKVIRIKSDKELIEFLELPSNGAFLLSQHILNMYESLFNKTLKINIHSLSIEILVHVFADTILVNMGHFSDLISHDKLKPVVNALESIRKHTKIIDCGEASLDNNRIIWDMLEPFHAVIYGIAELASPQTKE